jgi:hypothetical protein
MNGDRFGVGWRPELAAPIFAHLDRIDVVEVIADDYFRAAPKQVRALRTLAGQLPVTLHGVGLGLATTCPLETGRLDSMARLVDAVCPESWSEHLAFVRAGGIEIGHLAAPPRNEATLEATCRNATRAAAHVGIAPHLENVATFFDPPGSTVGEPEWLHAFFAAAPAGFLLDLHNVYTNSVNLGYDPMAFLERLPLDRVRLVHIAGGRMIGEKVLDDHLHDVPDIVYALLGELASLTPQPLTVILERDGKYPRIADLLAQLDRARRAVEEGRGMVAA